MKADEKRIMEIRSAVIEAVIRDLINEVDNEPNDSIALPIWRVMMRLRDRNPEP